MCDFKKQIELAQQEIANWPEEKKSHVQLEGIDQYFKQIDKDGVVEPQQFSKDI